MTRLTKTWTRSRIKPPSQSDKTLVGLGLRRGILFSRTVAFIMLVSLALVGCGKSADEVNTYDQSTGSEGEKLREIRFESPAVRKDGVISRRFECGGGSIWLPLRWDAPPPGTEELAVYLGRFVPGEGGGSRRLSVPFGIFITGIDPSTRGIPTNTLPPESSYITYKPFNSCPQDRRGQNVVLRLFALDRPISWGALGTPAVVEFTESTLRTNPSPSSTTSWLAELEERTVASGRIDTTYGR